MINGEKDKKSSESTSRKSQKTKKTNQSSTSSVCGDRKMGRREESPRGSPYPVTLGSGIELGGKVLQPQPRGRRKEGGTGGRSQQDPAARGIRQTLLWPEGRKAELLGRNKLGSTSPVITRGRILTKKPYSN